MNQLGQMLESPPPAQTMSDFGGRPNLVPVRWHGRAGRQAWLDHDSSERDAGGKPGSTFPHPALAIVLAFCFFWPLPCFAQPGPEQAATSVRIASEGARPPYNFLDGNELAGFEIELGRELCARMKVSCSFVVQDWDGLVPGLLQHHYDAIMAAIEITDEARAKIGFTDPYVRMPSAVLGSRENALSDGSPAGLAERRIGVESGGAHQAYAEDAYKQSEIVAYASLEDAILDLGEGRLDAVIGDKDALADFLKTRRDGQCCVLIADIPHDPAYFGDGIGIGLRPEDKALAAMFDKALAAIRSDGTFDRIRSRFFDFDVIQNEALSSVSGQARK